jgi:nucleoside-diphosphate-sugar epimerase
MSTILITGGNGFVGRHLVAALQARGDQVRVLALPKEDASRLEQRGAEVYRGDIRDPETLRAPVRGVDGVLHLAAMQDVWRPLDVYRAVNVGGTRNVARAALAAGVRRFVHMSSSSVYGMGHGHPVDETFPLTPFNDPYPVTKAEADRAVQRMTEQDGLPGVIIRPDQIFGPGDVLHFGAMAERMLNGRGFLVGNGDNRMPFVYVDDVVRGLLLALDHDKAAGNAYNITNDSPLTQRQMLEAIAEDVGARPPGRRIPYRALYGAGYLAERLARTLPSVGRPPVTRLGVAFFGTDNRYAIGKARSELGYRPGVSLRDAVRISAEWYLRYTRSAASSTAAGTEASHVTEGATI